MPLYAGDYGFSVEGQHPSGTLTDEQINARQEAVGRLSVAQSKLQALQMRRAWERASDEEVAAAEAAVEEASREASRILNA